MQETKECFKCSKSLPLAMFYKHSGMSDGYLGKCKLCARTDSTKRRNDNIESVRAYDRERGHRQKQSYHKEYRAIYPNAYRAVTMINNYVRDGKVTRVSVCEICDQETRTVAHHKDYLKPLDVMWLCQACHKQWHVKNGEGLNK